MSSSTIPVTRDSALATLIRRAYACAAEVQQALRMQGPLDLVYEELYYLSEIQGWYILRELRRHATLLPQAIEHPLLAFTRMPTYLVRFDTQGTQDEVDELTESLRLASSLPLETFLELAQSKADGPMVARGINKVPNWSPEERQVVQQLLGDLKKRHPEYDQIRNACVALDQVRDAFRL